MRHRSAPHTPEDPPDLFARLTPWLVAVCLTAGMGWLVQSADDSHVHVTSNGVERHQHGHLGAHSHDSSDGSDHDHVHEYAADQGEESGSESDSENSEDSESESGFLSAAWVAQSAPALPTGLPAFAESGQAAERAGSTPPTRDVASEAQPRAPPVVHGSARHSRAV